MLGWGHKDSLIRPRAGNGARRLLRPVLLPFQYRLKGLGSHLMSFYASDFLGVFLELLSNRGFKWLYRWLGLNWRRRASNPFISGFLASQPSDWLTCLWRNDALHDLKLFLLSIRWHRLRSLNGWNWRLKDFLSLNYFVADFPD